MRCVDRRLERVSAWEWAAREKYRAVLGVADHLDALGFVFFRTAGSPPSPWHSRGGAFRDPRKRAGRAPLIALKLMIAVSGHADAVWQPDRCRSAFGCQTRGAEWGRIALRGSSVGCRSRRCLTILTCENPLDQVFLDIGRGLRETRRRMRAGLLQRFHISPAPPGIRASAPRMGGRTTPCRKNHAHS